MSIMVFSSKFFNVVLKCTISFFSLWLIVSSFLVRLDRFPMFWKYLSEMRQDHCKCCWMNTTMLSKWEWGSITVSLATCFSNRCVFHQRSFSLHTQTRYHVNLVFLLEIWWKRLPPAGSAHWKDPLHQIYFKIPCGWKKGMHYKI